MCSFLQKLLTLCCICCLFVLTACNKDIPEPESIEEKQIVPVSDPIIYTFQHLSQQGWSIQHYVQNGILFVECVAPGVSFTGKTTDKDKGKILLFVDGEKKGEFNRAAFQVKNISKGKRKITVKVVTSDGQSFGQEKSFEITIP